MNRDDGLNYERILFEDISGPDEMNFFTNWEFWGTDSISPWFIDPDWLLHCAKNFGATSMAVDTFMSEKAKSVSVAIETTRAPYQTGADHDSYESEKDNWMEDLLSS